MKIGILTKYYRNFNCGGLLQAYALAKYLEKEGYDTEQISYIQNKPGIKSRFQSLKYKSKNILIQIRYRKLIAVNKNFIDFMLNVPHSKKIYNNETIGKTNKIYDVFIVGSDQIWNPRLCMDGYFLEYADKSKIKIAYAASIGIEQFQKQDEEIFIRELSKFDAISLRESSLKHSLELITGKDIKVVLDPTLLLPVKEWDYLSETSNFVKRSSFVFMYLLSGNPKQKVLIEKFAKTKGLDIISIPNTFNESFIGKYNYYGAGPKEFLSLIKEAEYVFTDSFHATVFSVLFEKKFGIFPREGNFDSEVRTTSRLEELLKTLHINNQWISDQNDFYKLDRIQNWDKIKTYLERNIKESHDFLLNSINYLKEKNNTV